MSSDGGLRSHMAYIFSAGVIMSNMFYKVLEHSGQLQLSGFIGPALKMPNDLLVRQGKRIHYTVSLNQKSTRSSLGSLINLLVRGSQAPR